MLVSHVFTGHDRQFERQKKGVTGYVRQVVILYRKDCMGICLGGFSTDHLRQVVIL